MLTRLLKARLPEGTQYLVDRPMRIRLVFVVLGSVLVAGLEMVALASIIPLVSLLTSGELGSPALEGLLAGTGTRSSTRRGGTTGWRSPSPTPGTPPR